MSAAVFCGKRSSPSAAFDVDHSPSSSKRSRFHRFSPSRSPLDHLRSFFPTMDPQVIAKALEASGDDIDSAIKSLNELCLEPSKVVVSSSVFTLENGQPGAVHIAEDILNNGKVKTSETVTPVEDGFRDGSEWVELFVMEMKNATDINDARLRALRALEALEKTIRSRVGSEAAQSFQQENAALKEQFEALLRENSILKRAVAIQHERQKEFDATNQELQHLKQLVTQYQDQLRTLEINNYALTVHLQRAQQNKSIPGGFNPDVF